MAEKKRDGEISRIVWGCFEGNKLGPIVFIDGIIRKEMASPEQYILEYIDVLMADGLVDLIFQ
jgi:hypothetical protein